MLQANHIASLSVLRVLSGDRLLITDNYMNETTKNIAGNSNVSLAVWSRDWEKKCVGYEIVGTAQYFTSGENYDSIRKIPQNDGYPCKGAILIKIRSVKKLA